MIAVPLPPKPQLRIFPLHGILEGPACTCPLGAECGDIGKHPMVGWRTYDENQKGPSGGYGIQTGHFNGIFVVDLDVKAGKNGIEAFTSLAANRPIPNTLAVRSPSGGVHLYFRLPPDVHVPNSRSKLGPGIDVRGEGGYVVGPGSPHKLGGVYQEVPEILADPPDWLLKLVVGEPEPTYVETEHYTVDPASPTGIRAIAWTKEFLARAEPAIQGQGGSDRLFAACCYITHSALPLDILRQLVEEVYNPRCEPPWSTKEIDHKLIDADRRPDQLPRGLAPEGFMERMLGRRTDTTHKELPSRSDGPMQPAEVLARLAAQGPAVHVPTGLRQLDHLTGGGPRLGDLVAILGAPDASKTMLCVALADQWEKRACVGIFAVDEDEEGIVTRLAQRRGWSRAAVERRERIEELQGKMPEMFIYDGTWQLDDAIEDLAERAADRPVIFICDSLQTVAEGLSAASDETQAQAVSRALAMLRIAARDLRWLVIVTSEMVRAAYNGSGEARTAALASGKWSGSIEYASKLLLALKPVEGEPDLVQLEVAKNKLGPHGELHLRIDRANQHLIEETHVSSESTNASTLSKQALRIISWLSARGGVFHGSKSALQKAIGMKRNTFFDALSTIDGTQLSIIPAKGFSAPRISLLPGFSDEKIPEHQYPTSNPEGTDQQGTSTLTSTRGLSNGKRALRGDSTLSTHQYPVPQYPSTPPLKGEGTDGEGTSSPTGKSLFAGLPKRPR